MAKEAGVTNSVAQRRLVAVLIADIDEYTRLMGEDEDATMAAWWVLQARDHRSQDRELPRPNRQAHGRWFPRRISQRRGHAKCALEIQTEIAERNKGVPAEKCVEFRIGLNLCDVVADDEDI